MNTLNTILFPKSHDDRCCDWEEQCIDLAYGVLDENKISDTRQHLMECDMCLTTLSKAKQAYEHGKRLATLSETIPILVSDEGVLDPNPFELIARPELRVNLVQKQDLLSLEIGSSLTALPKVNCHDLLSQTKSSIGLQSGKRNTWCGSLGNISEIQDHLLELQITLAGEVCKTRLVVMRSQPASLEKRAALSEEAMQPIFEEPPYPVSEELKKAASEEPRKTIYKEQAWALLTLLIAKSVPRKRHRVHGAGNTYHPEIFPLLTKRPGFEVKLVGRPYTDTTGFLHFRISSDDWSPAHGKTLELHLEGLALCSFGIPSNLSKGDWEVTAKLEGLDPKALAQAAQENSLELDPGCLTLIIKAAI